MKDENEKFYKNEEEENMKLIYIYIFF